MCCNYRSVNLVLHMTLTLLLGASCEQSNVSIPRANMQKVDGSVFIRVSRADPTDLGYLDMNTEINYADANLSAQGGVIGGMDDEIQGGTDGSSLAGMEDEIRAGTEGEMQAGTEGEMQAGTEGEVTAGTEGEVTAGTEDEIQAGTENEIQTWTLEACINLSTDELWQDQDRDEVSVLNPHCEPFRSDLGLSPSVNVPFHYFSNAFNNGQALQSSIYNDLNREGLPIDLSSDSFVNLENWSFEHIISWKYEVEIESAKLLFLIENPASDIFVDYEIYFGPNPTVSNVERDDMIAINNQTISFEDCSITRGYQDHSWCSLTIPSQFVNQWLPARDIKHYFAVKFNRIVGGLQNVAHISSAFYVQGVEDCNDNDRNEWFYLDVGIDEDADYYPDSDTITAMCTDDLDLTWIYLRDQLDCYDQNPQVHPLAEFHSVPYDDQNFDWNCDGAVTPQNLITHNRCTVSRTSDQTCSYDVQPVTAECGSVVTLNRCRMMQDINANTTSCSSLGLSGIQSCR